MAHTYVITNVAHINDSATVTGTVDGIPVTVQCNWSAITGESNTTAVQNFLAPLMLNAAIPTGPISTAIYNGTFTQ
jgi:hypothetical protein